jgi:hypothetical protein
MLSKKIFIEAEKLQADLGYPHEEGRAEIGVPYHEITDHVQTFGDPLCPKCSADMYPLDDHGRFACKCGYRTNF